MEALPPLRQKCLAYLLCEVGLRVATKTKDQGAVNKLMLQFTHMLKDFLFEKVSGVFCLFFVGVCFFSFMIVCFEEMQQ